MKFWKKKISRWFQAYYETAFIQSFKMTWWSGSANPKPLYDWLLWFRDGIMWGSFWGFGSGHPRSSSKSIRYFLTCQFPLKYGAGSTWTAFCVVYEKGSRFKYIFDGIFNRSKRDVWYGQNFWTTLFSLRLFILLCSTCLWSQRAKVTIFAQLMRLQNEAKYDFAMPSVISST